MGFSASAPCKAILFGEHYVVYGSPALCLAIEPRNKVSFSKKSGAGIRLISRYGEGRIGEGFSFEGPSELAAFAQVAKSALAGQPIPSCEAAFEHGWGIKGVGLSASFCAAFAAGLYRLIGASPAPEQVFAAAQSGDLVAHGGRASGIDAKTVAYGCPLLFQRKFSPPSFDSNQVKFSLPKDCSLLLIDTDSGKKDGTSAMLERFASSFGIKGSPQDASEDARSEVRAEYAPLWEKAATTMLGKKAAGETLGLLMNENHLLLKKRGMSPAGMEKAVSAALSSGALGAKLTGAGGEGGAALALCKSSQCAGIAKGITASTGFACHALSMATSGAKADLSLFTILQGLKKFRQLAPRG